MTGPRRATHDDIPACAKIVWDWEQQTDWMPPGPTEARLIEMIGAVFDAREIWVVGDPVAGYLSVDPAQNLVGGLYLAQTGEGLGKALMDRAKAGRDYLTLTTHMPNMAAQRFYAREGFVPVEEVPAKQSDLPAELRMEWRR